MMRTLYYVPILLHAPEEFGSLAKPLLEIAKRIRGPDAEKIYRERACQYWLEVIRRLDESGLNAPEKCRKMHIYVDGLPQAEDKHVQKVVEQLIELKLPQYLIIQKLLGKGAIIHGTESLQLLLEEHEMWTKTAQGITPNPKRKAELLQERDEFIAKRINETLPEDGIGILFMGAAHKVDNELKKFFDIKVIYFLGGQ